MKIKEISYSDILPLWEMLWENRKSKIEPINGMLFNGGYSQEILFKYRPHFLACFDGSKIIGVNSLFQTDAQGYFRSRGLFVLPDYRNQKIGLKLLNESCHFAHKLKGQFIWTLPRKKALPVYLKAGFHTVGEWITDNVEFGPNIYAIRSL